MARQFGQYSPVVPLGVTWEEQLQLLQDDGSPVSLIGYDVIWQFCAAKPDRDADTGLPTTDPEFELTTAGWYSVAPAWPVFEAISIPTPTNGTIQSLLDFGDLWTASPDNSKRKLYMSIVLVNPDTLYAIPVVQGVAVFLQATTVPIVS